MRVGAVLLALSILAVACGGPPATTPPACEASDASPTSNPDAGASATISVNVLLVDQTGAIGEQDGDPLWVGYQGGDSKWHPATRTAPGRFRFPIDSNAYQFAVVCGESGADPWSEINLVHATVAEAQNLTLLCAAPLAGSPPPSFTVYIQGPAPHAKVWMGGWDSGLPVETVGPSVGFAFPTLATSSDLVVGRRRYVASTYEPWEFLLLRDFSTPRGGSYIVDFDMEPWYASEARAAAVEGFELQSADEYLDVDLITSGGTWVDLTRWTYFPNSTDVSNGIPFVALPAAATEAGDLHRVSASKELGKTARIVRRYDRDLPSNLTLRLPAAVSDVEVSAAATVPDCPPGTEVMVPQIRWAPQPDLQFFSWYVVLDDRRAAFVIASAGWLDGRSRYVMANPSGAAGWDPAWLPPPQPPRSWQFGVVRSDVALADAIHLMEAGMLNSRSPPLDHAEIASAVVEGP